MKIKNLSLVLLLSVFIVITSVVILKRYESETLVEAKWNEKEDTLLAITIDGEDANAFPTTSNYKASVSCTNGTGEAVWNGSKWLFNVSAINQAKAKCNIDFIAPASWEKPGTGTLLAAIKRDNTVTTPTTTPGADASATDEAILASAEDDYGTSYYFRGAVENNYVEYANMCWRIVRVTGDSSIKLVLYNYNGLTDSNNTPSSDTPCSETDSSFGFARFEGDTYKSKFNTSYGDNAYIGFMYGNVGCSDGTSTTQLMCTNAGGTWTASTSYTTAHANINPSTLLTNLNKWYSNILSKQTAFKDSQLADTIWCNDKSVVTDSTFNPGSMTLGTNYGYGTNTNYYSAAQRLSLSSSWSAGGNGPSLICPNDNSGGKLSKFTVSDTEYGNGSLSGYGKIGLLTADEVAFAGGTQNKKNNSFYLRPNTSAGGLWTLTPQYFRFITEEQIRAHVYPLYSAIGMFYDARTTLLIDLRGTLSLRPSLSLVSTTKISSGTGTATDPYKVAY